jgi:hypothetical protein
MIPDKAKLKEAILIGLAKKGPKGKEMDQDDHLLAIAQDMLAAVKDEDPEALRDLLAEAFECLGSKDDE